MKHYGSLFLNFLNDKIRHLYVLHIYNTWIYFKQFNNNNIIFIICIFLNSVRSSQHHRGGSKGDADEGDRVQKILEAGQDWRDHLGRDIHDSDPVGRGVRPPDRDRVLRWQIDLLLRSPLHLFARSSAWYRALSGYQQI